METYTVYTHSSAVNLAGSFDGYAFRGGQVKAETASSVTLPRRNTGEMERMKTQFEVELLQGVTATRQGRRIPNSLRPNAR